MWVARDRGGTVFVYYGENPPVKVEILGIWKPTTEDDDGLYCEIKSTDFLGSLEKISWEDNEAREIKIVLKSDIIPEKDLLYLLKTLKRLNLLNPEMIKTEENFNNLIKTLCG